MNILNALMKQKYRQNFKSKNCFFDWESDGDCFLEQILMYEVNLNQLCLKMNGRPVKEYTMHHYSHKLKKEFAERQSH